MDRIQFRRDTSANWTTYNPVLMEGEVGYETDTKMRKIGDGTHNWNDLDYLAAENITNDFGDNENAVLSQKSTSNILKLLGDSTGLYTGLIKVNKESPGPYEFILDSNLEFSALTYYEVEIIDTEGVLNSFGFMCTNTLGEDIFSRDLSVNTLHKTIIFYTGTHFRFNFSSTQINKSGTIKYYFRINTVNNNINYFDSLVNDTIYKDNGIFIKTYYTANTQAILIDFSEIGELHAGDLFDIYLYDENNRIDSFGFRYRTTSGSTSYSNSKALNSNTLYESEEWLYNGSDLYININNEQINESTLPIPLIAYIRWRYNTNLINRIESKITKIENNISNNISLVNYKIGYNYYKGVTTNRRILLFSGHKIKAGSLFDIQVNALDTDANSYGFYYRNINSGDYSYTKNLNVNTLYKNEEWLHDADIVYLNFSSVQFPSGNGEVEVYFKFAFEDSLVEEVYNIKDEISVLQNNKNLLQDYFIDNKIIVQNPTTSLEQFNTSTADVSIIRETDKKFYMAHSNTFAKFNVDINVSNDLVKWDRYSDNIIPESTITKIRDLCNDEYSTFWAVSIIKWYYYYYLCASIQNQTGLVMLRSSQLENGYDFIGETKYLITKEEVGIEYDVIDPCLVEDLNGDKYVFFGSRFGNYRIKLSNDCSSYEGEIVHVAGLDKEAAAAEGVSNWEGIMLYYHPQLEYWYMFLSPRHHYKVYCWRAKNLTDTFVDHLGRTPFYDWSRTQDNTGYLVMDDNPDEDMNETGHIGEIQRDDEGNYFITCHYRVGDWSANPSYGNRQQMINQLFWNEDGFPYTINNKAHKLTKYPIIK